MLESLYEEAIRKKGTIQEQIEDKIADFYLDHPTIKELSAHLNDQSEIVVAQKEKLPATSTEKIIRIED